MYAVSLFIHVTNMKLLHLEKARFLYFRKNTEEWLSYHVSFSRGRLLCKASCTSNDGEEPSNKEQEDIFIRRNPPK